MPDEPNQSPDTNQPDRGLQDPAVETNPSNSVLPPQHPAAPHAEPFTGSTTPAASQPAQALPATQPVTDAPKDSPLTLVLQWLTYAFWGWTVLAMAYLTLLGVMFFVHRSDSDFSDSSMIAYGLAAVLVLFVISIICDMFYARREPEHKRGPAMLIMIIHAVIFALFGIGAVITAVFAIVNIIIGGGVEEHKTALTVLITSMIIAVVYAATLLRTLRPFHWRRVTLIYAGFMALVTISITALGIAGPAHYSAITKDDRLIETGLPQLSQVIRNHTAKTDKLPGSLAEVKDEAHGDGKTLIERNLVEYQPGKAISESTTKIAPESTLRPIVLPADTETSYSYKLCVTYREAKNNSPQYYDYYADPNNTEAVVSPSTYHHDKGRVCYDLRTTHGSTY